MRALSIEINDLIVNPENDRHGSLETEADAIAWLIEKRWTHMKALAKHIAEHGRIFDMPMVIKSNGGYIVKDGNRRVTCLKLLINPHFAPEKSRDFFLKLRQNAPDLQTKVLCQVEDSEEVADEIVDVRHGGIGEGEGQTQWDVRAQANYRKRLGKDSKYAWSEAIEQLLVHHGEHELAASLTRSNLDKLLGAQKRRDRIGLTYASPEKLLSDKDNKSLLDVARKIATDTVKGQFTLHDVLNSKGKDTYISDLIEDGNVVEPQMGFAETRAKPLLSPNMDPPQTFRRQPDRDRLIPKQVPDLDWTHDQEKISRIWKELQHDLKFPKNELSIALAMRVLIELVCEDYRKHCSKPKANTLAENFKSLVTTLRDKRLIDNREFNDFCRIADDKTSALSIESLQRIVHSQTLMPLQTDSINFWRSIQPAIIAALMNVQASKKAQSKPI